MPRSQQVLLAAAALYLLAAECVVSAGKFDAYKTCDVCVAAGFGWHEEKGRCGGYSTRVCSAATEPRAQEQGQAKAMSVADMVKEIRGYFERAGAPPSAADRKLLTFKGHEEELLNDLRRKAQPAPTPPAPKTDVDDEDWDDDWDDVEGEDDDEDEPEILRFSMEKAKSLMSHRLKHQLVLFMSEEDKRSGKAVEQLEEALRNGGYADKALGLHIPTDIRENNPVLERFFVDPTMTPALRIAVMYPKGNGLKVYGARGHEGQRGALRDGSLKGLKEFTNALIDHFAGKSEPLLKSESEPGLQHTTIADLVGDNVDSWLNNRNTHNLLLLYWSDCQHCDDLMPAYEALAQRIDQAHGAIPTGEKMIRIGRMEGVKNDVAHPRIYAGSYPMMYFVAADDKEHAIQIDHDSADMANSEAVVWEFLQQNTWLEGGKRSGPVHLDPSNYQQETTGKAVFLKFYAPWCGHCKALKPAWDELSVLYARSEALLVAEVDCTASGKPLCESHGVKGFPSIKYGRARGASAAGGGGSSSAPLPALESYPQRGGRDFAALKKFVGQKLGPPPSRDEL